MGSKIIKTKLILEWIVRTLAVVSSPVTIALHCAVLDFD
jgi:hypothetical protein